MSEDMVMLRQDIKGALENFSGIVESSLASIKDDTNEKCKTLAEPVILMHENISKLDARTKTRREAKKKLAENVKPTTKTTNDKKGTAKIRKTYERNSCNITRALFYILF